MANVVVVLDHHMIELHADSAEYIVHAVGGDI